jgi:hypothetical protein
MELFKNFAIQNFGLGIMTLMVPTWLRYPENYTQVRSYIPDSQPVV